MFRSPALAGCSPCPTGRLSTRTTRTPRAARRPAPVLAIPGQVSQDGTFGTVATSNGVKQITYNGSPLYTFKGAKALTTNGNGVGGVWHVIKMSESNIVGGAS